MRKKQSDKTEELKKQLLENLSEMEFRINNEIKVLRNKIITIFPAQQITISSALDLRNEDLLKQEI